jgi:hypothetical protein
MAGSRNRSRKPAAAEPTGDAPEPIRDHFVPGVVGPMTAEESAAWWAAHPPDPAPADEADASQEAPATPGPSDSEV